jgi:FkbM family methyltransferase
MRVAPSLGSPLRYLCDVARSRREATYWSRRLEFHVTIRPRDDLQVSRELLSKDAYAMPDEVAARMPSAGSIRVLDLGANIGLFALSIYRQLKSADIFCFEPDPSNLKLLSRNIIQNGLGDSIKALPYAAAAQDGEVRFVSDGKHTSHIARDPSETAQLVTQYDIFPLASSCELIKMDIEGGEWEILRDPRFASLPFRAVVLEWHGRKITGTGSGQEARSRLEAAGLDVRIEPGSSDDLGSLWAWR